MARYFTRFGTDFGTIEIICIPCHKCEKAEKTITEAFYQLEKMHKVNYMFKFKKTIDLRCAQKYSANVSQTPFVIIRDRLVFAGKIEDIRAVRLTLMNLLKY